MNTGWQRIFKLKKQAPAPKEKRNDNNRDTAIMAALAPYAKTSRQSNLTEVKIDYVTRKTKVIFVLLPEWAWNFPPYNIARLVAVSKQAGYETLAYDLNAKARQDYVFNRWNIDYDPWDGTRDWKWLPENYFKELHPNLEPFLLDYIDKIIKAKPAVIGFSLYYCNEAPTKWMAEQIKLRLPDVKIIVGGPNCQNSYWKPEPCYDYAVTGEGEQMLLQILESIENGSAPNKQLQLRQEEGERLDLDSLPVPDYGYFPPDDYGIPNGVNMELSRGCTAKCTFCSETHFWKYRGRMSRNVLDEVSDLYYNRGVDVIWFLDSLVNGNLKELRAFCKGVIASGMKIHWTGYARCDERMDLEYYQDLANSGCLSLSYGIESGSNRVLKDIDKGITVDEIEKNLEYGRITEVEAFSTWFVGFPTEEPQDLYDSLTLLWRNRNNNLTHIAVGHFVIPPDTIVAQNMEKFGVGRFLFENAWMHSNYTNSKFHRLIRLKSFNIVMDLMVNEKNIDFGSRPALAEKHYNIKFDDPTKQNVIDYEEFDFNICPSNLPPFAASLLNEIWPLLRLIWRARGGYKMSLNFSPELDLPEFGDMLAGQFWAMIAFKINDAGQWKARIQMKFEQSKDAWKFHSFDSANSVAARRARKLARPGSNGDVVYENSDFVSDMAFFKQNVEQQDYSFKYEFIDGGQWTK